jgi:hypothetical protein
VTVYYPWHPLCGQSLRVHRQETRECRGGQILYCEFPDGTIVAVPGWMTRPETANYVIGPPQVSTEALLELRSLVDALQEQSSHRREKK